MASGSGRSQPQTPTSQQNFPPGSTQAQAAAAQSIVSQVAPVPATSMMPDENAKAKASQQALISLAAPTAASKPAEMQQVDQKAVKNTHDGEDAAIHDQLGSIPAKQATQHPKMMQQPGVEGVPEKVVVTTSGSVMVRGAGASSATVAAPFDERQQPNPAQFSTQQVPPMSGAMPDETAAKRQQRQGVGQEHFRLTASNLDKHEQLLISQRSSSNQLQQSRQGMVINGVMISNIGSSISGGGGPQTMKSQVQTQVVVPSAEAQQQPPPTALSNAATVGPSQAQQQLIAPPSITIQAPSNPGPGRPVGSNNAARKQKAQQQAAAAAQAQAQQQQMAQIQQQQSSSAPSSQPPPQNQPVLPNQNGDPSSHPPAVLSQQQQQKLLMQMKAQQAQQQQQQRNFSSEYIAYQQQAQHRQLQQQNSSASLQGGPGAHTQAQQEALLRHQQAALAAQQASQGHGGHPSAAQSQQQAYQMQQQLNGEQSQKFFAQFVNRRVHQCFQDKLTCLQQTDKQNNDSLAKQIKKEETAFFLKNDDTKYQKVSLLEVKNQRMDEYISLMAENGGRVIPKQLEPVPTPRETPVIVEMRYQHMEFVEESYWKRVMASRLAHQCQVVAIRKAKERVERAQQEQVLAQEKERLEELRKREDEQKAVGIETQLHAPTALDQPMQDTGVVKDQMIDTTQGAGAGGQLGAGNGVGGLEGEQDFMSQQNLFGGDLLDHSFEDPMRDPVGENYDLDVLSMGAGQDDIMQPDDLMDDLPGNDDGNIASGFPADEPDQNYDENFDPEQEIRRQEEILEQQRIEESKKQELEKLKKIDEIEKLSAEGGVTLDKQIGMTSQKRRVLENLLDDSDIDSDREDQLAALEEELMNIDLTYLRPCTAKADDELSKKDRNLRQITDLEKNANDELSKAVDEEMSEQPNGETAPQTAQNKTIVDCAQGAMKLQLDKLAQMILDNKEQSASELIHDAQFSQALDSIVKTGDFIGGANQGSLLDKVQNLMQSEKEVGLYMMPGMEAFDFEEGEDAFEIDGEVEDPGNESSQNVDIDHFFTDIKMIETKEESTIQPFTKLKPPSVVGHEQQRMYEELKEINQLAPERSDLTHMEHLCQFWIEREKEEIEEKRNVIKYFEKNLQEDDQRSEHNMDRKQRSVLQHNIQQHTENIEKRKSMIEKFQQPAYSAKILHKDRFLLTGQEQPVLQQPSLAPQEFSFIKWYYALFPDQWRLIADIVNYHPLTRGPLHSKEFMAREYFSRLDQLHRDLLVGRQKIQMQPWRETGLPWLVNGRQGCLMNSLTYINKSHLTSIHRMSRLTKKKRTTKKVYTFVLNQQGCLELVVQQQEQQKVTTDQDIPNQIATNAALKAESEQHLAGAKRIRSELQDTDGESHENGQDSDSDVVDILLTQMLARRRKTEREETLAAQNGTLVKSDIYSDRPFLKELMIDIAYKRRKMDADSNAQNVPKFIAFTYNPKQVKKDELNINTPMWYALQNQQSCQMTIRVQHSTMFWLGYFIRRIMHEDNLYKLKMSQYKNMQGWEAQNEIKNYFINQAKKIRLEGKQLGYQHRLIKEKEDSDSLQKEIQHFLRAQASAPSTRADAISFVNDLWDGKSPYQYDKEQRAEYIKQEKDNVERISNVMSQKSKHLWEELQFYWFQVNKNLHPRYRKVEHNQPNSQGAPAAVSVDPQAAAQAAQAAYGQQQQYPGQAAPGQQQQVRQIGPGVVPIDPAAANQARYLNEQQQKALQSMAPMPPSYAAGYNTQQSSGKEPFRKQLSIAESGVAGASGAGPSDSNNRSLSGPLNMAAAPSNSGNRASMMAQQSQQSSQPQQQRSAGQGSQGGMLPGVAGASQSQPQPSSSQPQQFNMQNISAMNSTQIGAISASQSGAPVGSQQQAYQGSSIRSGAQGPPSSQPVPSSQQQRRQQPTGQQQNPAATQQQPSSSSQQPMPAAYSSTQGVVAGHIEGDIPMQGGPPPTTTTQSPPNQALAAPRGGGPGAPPLASQSLNISNNTSHGDGFNSGAGGNNGNQQQ